MQLARINKMSAHISVVEVFRYGLYDDFGSVLTESLRKLVSRLDREEAFWMCFFLM